MRLSVTTFTGDSNNDLWAASQALRWAIFVIEQKVPFVAEMDARDLRSSTVHVTASIDGTPPKVVATCRILPDGNWHYHLGRVAVDRAYRGQGIGRDLMNTAARIISDLVPEGEAGVIVLDAQVQAQVFYESCGYSLTDKPKFLDANIWHKEMKRTITGRKKPDLEADLSDVLFRI